jgi:membrane-bound metal-dependent hydrolase YbcI (DUF457 family)
MPYSFTHFVFAVLLVEIFRRTIKDKKNFPKHYLLIVLAGALFPDLDIIVYFLVSKFGYGFYDIHRTLTHSIFIPIILLIIAIVSRKRKKLFSNVFMILSIAIFSHLALDLIVSGKLELFCPLSNIKVGLNLISLLPESMYNFVLPIIDTVVLVAVVLWLDLKKLKPNLFK